MLKTPGRPAGRPGKWRLIGRLYARVKNPGDEEWSDLGCIAHRIVTAVAIADLISILQGGAATNLQNYKYHATGTGTNPESAANTALQTEVETRDLGTQISPGAGVYRTVATHTYAAGFGITEHGVFSNAVGPLLLDRSVFSAIPVVNGTQIEWTYDLTASGS